MIIFKNHNAGFAFLEIMIAITLLAIFGTSLFMTQANIFKNISRTHRKVMDCILRPTIWPDFIIKKIEAQKEKKDLNLITIDKEIKAFATTLQLKIKKIPEKSVLYQDFGDYLQVVDQTIMKDDKKNHMISFLFNPPPAQEKIDISHTKTSDTKNNNENSALNPTLTIRTTMIELKG